MRGRELHVVIGAGIAGCTAAIMRRLAGYEVIILDKARSSAPQVYPICTETSTVVSENHSGAEYPYDAKSTTDCLDGRIANENFFPDFIYAGKIHTRILASLSMMLAGEDIRARCRESIHIISRHYAQRVEEDASNYVFGDPDSICTELETFEGVNDVAAAFVTPQRGLNPVYVAALLEAEIKRLGIEFLQGHEVTNIEKNVDGTASIHFLDESGRQDSINVDQVCIAAAGRGFHLSKMLNPMLNLPEIYFALRQISFVNLPQGTHKNYSCLKLEDQYGGMLSPLNQACAMIYHPPAAHIEIAMLDPVSGNVPAAFLQSLHDGHPELEERAQQTLHKLRDFYPELEHAELLSSHLKIAINTVAVSRVRRNMPIFQVAPGCTMIVLPKWTMAVVNARKDLDLALDYSVQRNTLTQAQKKAIMRQAIEHTLPVPESWKANFSTFLGVALQHAHNMHLPATIIHPMAIDNMQSLRVEIQTGV
jgi:glycine/D-amino acid oxidase-like deaminating enzyme